MRGIPKSWSFFQVNPNGPEGGIVTEYVKEFWSVNGDVSRSSVMSFVGSGGDG